MDVSRQWTHDRLGKELRSFGHRLCSARESAGLDLEDVAQQTSLNRDRIASMERGHVDPFIDEVVPLAHLLSVTLDYLSGLSDQRAPRVAANSRSTRSAAQAGTGNPGPVTEAEGRPWEDHGPRIVKSIPLQDIDHTDKRFQFRFPSNSARLRKSLASTGQRNPIKVMPGDRSYVIIDGHSRVAEARQFGWEQIKALVYPVMPDREAKRLALESNIVRKNLTADELANAMLVARNEGLTLKEIAALFCKSTRQVDRYLELLPAELSRLVDGQGVTMAHARVLKRLSRTGLSCDVEGLAAWVRETGASVKELRRKVRKDLCGKRGRKKKFGRIEEGRVRGYTFEIGPQSSTEDRAEALAFLRAAIRAIEAQDGRSRLHPQKQTGTTTGEQGC